MKITQLQNVIRVGQIVRKEGHDQKLDLIADAGITREQLKAEVGRVYMIVVDGTIFKIGGSQAKGGIKGTLGAYFTGFAKGMSARTYCVWNFMRQCIDRGETVEIYVVFAPLVTAEIPGPTGPVTVTIPVDFHTIEKSFVDFFVASEGKHPFLNMQESAGRWEDTGLLEGYSGLWVPKTVDILEQ
jgi:hypothetical protein